MSIAQSMPIVHAKETLTVENFAEFTTKSY